MLAIAQFRALSALRRRPDEELVEETAGTIDYVRKRFGRTAQGGRNR
jgi:hypothetical protein